MTMNQLIDNMSGNQAMRNTFICRLNLALIRGSWDAPDTVSSAFRERNQIPVWVFD